MLELGGIVLSLLAFFGSGSARFLQLREKLVTVMIGLVFAGSARHRATSDLPTRAGLAQAAGLVGTGVV